CIKIDDYKIVLFLKSCYNHSISSNNSLSLFKVFNMKKIFFSTAFILLFGLMGFSQNSEIKLLMKNATSVVVPNNFKYFHLVDSSFPIDFDEKSMTSNELQKLRNDFPDFPYEEFLSLAKSDTSL